MRVISGASAVAPGELGAARRHGVSHNHRVRIQLAVPPARSTKRLSIGIWLVAVAGACAAALGEPAPESPMAPGEHSVKLNGARLWFKIAGTAHAGQAPLLYLHGGPGYNSYSFEKTIGSRLERRALLIYLDERGSGRSERPTDRNYAMSTLIADVEALRDYLGVPQLAVMGHSFGGTIALEYAAHHPEHVQKLIIVDGAADLPNSFGLWQQEIRRRYPWAWTYALSSPQGRALEEARRTGDVCAIAKAGFAVDMVALGTVNAPEFHHWQQFRDQRYRREQDALDEASGLHNTGELGGIYFGPDSKYPCYRFSSFSRLTMPMLVIVGTYDGAIGVQSMRVLAKAAPHGRYDEFDASAHFPYAEEPAKFERDVAAFLAE
jgi:proline iminopeptidase